MIVRLTHERVLPEAPGQPNYQWRCEVHRTVAHVEDFSGTGPDPLSAALDLVHQLGAYIDEENL